MFTRQAAFLLVLLPLLAADAPNKEAKKDKAVTDANAKAIDKDNRALEGLWQVVGQELNGHAAPKGFYKDLYFEFAGGRKFRIRGKAKDFGDFAPYRIDPSKNPKEIDIKLFDDEWTPAIYKVDHETLTIVWGARKDTDRPKEFKTERGDRLRLFTLKRVKE